MREEELIQLIRKIQKRQSEFQNVELKAAETGFPGRIYDTLSSFSNQDEGGILIFGISEKNNYEAVGVYNIENAQKKATEACEQMEPVVRAVFTNTEIDGKYVLSMEIPPVEYYKRPVFYKGAGRLKGSFIRVGDADEPMSEYEIYSYEAFRGRIHDELRTVNEAKIELFNKDRISEYLTSVKKSRKNLAINVPDKEILELMGITSDGTPTLAGTLVFSLYPQTWFPQLCVTAVAVPGTEIGDLDETGSRFLDNERITGSIPDILDESVEFIRKNMRTRTIIDSNGKRADKTEYPIIAIREALLNALIHRDYSIFTENTPITIELYRDRMVITSKGGLYGGGSVNQLGESRPETRNPALANILEILKITENRYSGIPTIRKLFKEAGLPEPEFKVKRGVFSVIFRNGIEIDADEIDKSDIVNAVIQFCSTPKSREDITEFVGKSRYHVMSNIVYPLVEQERLKMTIPEKPKSSYQRFVRVQ